jgi:hypothetical protein
MTNFYEERLREITAMLHLEVVQETEWMKHKLEEERKQILEEVRCFE